MCFTTFYAYVMMLKPYFSFKITSMSEGGGGLRRAYEDFDEIYYLVDLCFDEKSQKKACFKPYFSFKITSNRGF